MTAADIPRPSADAPVDGTDGTSSMRERRPLRVVALGYSNVGDRGLRVLDAHPDVELPLVVTHRDAPGEVLWYRRVADTAAELGLAVAYAEDFADDAALVAAVAAARPDAIVSLYFRRMLPQALLDLCPGRAFNLHGSLLPKFRGRAPTNWAVLKGASETGATLHEMTAKPDAGAIVGQLAVPILPHDTAEEVFDKVCVAAETVLWRALPSIVAGEHPRLPNDLAQGSYFGGRKPEDGRIDFARPAKEVYDLIRAVAPPYPGAFVETGGERFVVAAARPLAPSDATGIGLDPGLHAVDGRLILVAGDGGRIAVHRLTRPDGTPVGPGALETTGGSDAPATPVGPDAPAPRPTPNDFE